MSSLKVYWWWENGGLESLLMHQPMEKLIFPHVDFSLVECLMWMSLISIVVCILSFYKRHESQSQSPTSVSEWAPLLQYQLLESQVPLLSLIILILFPWMYASFSIKVVSFWCQGCVLFGSVVVVRSTWFFGHRQGSLRTNN